MSNSISNIILRLARRHLPIDAVATEAAPAPAAPELPTLWAVPLATGMREPGGDYSAVSASSAFPTFNAESAEGALQPVANDFKRPHSPASASPGISKSDSDDNLHRNARTAQAPQPAAGGCRTAEVTQPTTGSHLDESTEIPAANFLFDHDRAAFTRASIDWHRAQQSDPAQTRFYEPNNFAPAFPSPTNRQSNIENRSLESIEQRGRPQSGGSHNQSQLDAVGESSRQLEQTARDLETSLTRLFTTQIETLQRLRDRIAEHERRWVEQQGARRATL